MKKTLTICAPEFWEGGDCDPGDVGRLSRGTSIWGSGDGRCTSDAPLLDWCGNTVDVRTALTIWAVKAPEGESCDPGDCVGQLVGGLVLCSCPGADPPGEGCGASVGKGRTRTICGRIPWAGGNCEFFSKKLHADIEGVDSSFEGGNCDPNDCASELPGEPQLLGCQSTDSTPEETAVTRLVAPRTLFWLTSGVGTDCTPLEGENCGPNDRASAELPGGPQLLGCQSADSPPEETALTRLVEPRTLFRPTSGEGSDSALEDWVLERPRRRRLFFGLAVGADGGDILLAVATATGFLSHCTAVGKEGRMNHWGWRERHRKGSRIEYRAVALEIW